uniref:SERPIN domain-containing protein n=1 Tax=Steinernema glaseri TaxID=37863 RepID=A0A1I7YUK0_9BILA
MKVHYALALLVTSAVSALNLGDLLVGNFADLSYALAYVVKRSQFETSVVATEKLLNATIEDLLVSPSNTTLQERLISACTLHNPSVALQMLDSNILFLDKYSLTVLALYTSDFGFSEYRTMQMTLTKTAFNLLNAYTYCESVKTKGQLTERDQDKLAKAYEWVRNTVKQALEGARIQRELFWSTALKAATEGFIKDKLGSDAEPTKVVSSVHKFIADKYGDTENHGILGERFGVFMHSRNDKVLQKFASSSDALISIPFGTDSLVNVYRVSRNKVAWTTNYEAFEKNLPDIKAALSNATEECLARFDRIQEVHQKALDAAASVYKFPVFYLVPNVVERDAKWAVDNGKFRVDGDSFVEKVAVEMCADKSTLSVYYHVFVGL